MCKVYPYWRATWSAKDNIDQYLIERDDIRAEIEAYKKDIDDVKVKIERHKERINNIPKIVENLKVKCDKLDSYNISLENELTNNKQLFEVALANYLSQISDERKRNYFERNLREYLQWFEKHQKEVIDRVYDEKMVDYWKEQESVDEYITIYGQDGELRAHNGYLYDLKQAYQYKRDDYRKQRAPLIEQALRRYLSHSF